MNKDMIRMGIIGAVLIILMAAGAAIYTNSRDAERQIAAEALAKDEGLRFELVAERLRGETASFDIKDKKGKVLVDAGRRITARHIMGMNKAGLTTLDVVDDYIFGKALAKEVVDTSTGEVIAQANEEVVMQRLG